MSNTIFVALAMALCLCSGLAGTVVANEASLGYITPDLAAGNQNISAEVRALLDYDSGEDYQTAVGVNETGYLILAPVKGSGNPGWKDSGLRNIEFAGLPEGSKVTATECSGLDFKNNTYEFSDGSSTTGWGISDRVTLFTVTDKSGMIIWQGWYYSQKESFGIKLTASC